MKKTKHKKIRTSTSRKIFNVCNITLLTLAALSCFLPLMYVIAVSLSGKAFVQAGEVTFWPKGFSTVAYEYLLTKKVFWDAFFMSVKVTALGTTINLVMVMMTAYPLSKTSDRLTGRGVYAWYFFFTMLIGGGLIPTYVLVSQLGLRDTIWALVLPGALPIFNTVLMINFFRQIPIELEDTARIDGAGPMKILWSIYVPLSKPAVATIALFCMVGHWNGWFSGMIYMTSPEKRPLQTYLRSVVIQMDMSQFIGDDYSLLQLLSDDTLKCAQILVAMIPILCVYPFMQKYFVKGIVLGGVKG